MSARESGPAEIIVCRDGPLLLRGHHRVLDEEGRPIDTNRPTTALCRCGKSSMRPLCDGSHRSAGFQAAGGPEGRARRLPWPPADGDGRGGEVGDGAPAPSGLPAPVGPTSAAIIEALGGAPGRLTGVPDPPGDPLSDDDLHLSLFLCHQVADRGFAGVRRDWADDPSLVAVRHRLAGAFLDAVIDDLGPLPPPGDIADRLQVVIAADDAPPVASRLADRGSEAQLRELLVHRSAYLLKEADPHLRVVPFLRGLAKAALVEILADEHGGGRLERMHAELYGRALTALGMDRRENAHLDRLPGVSLATVNLTSALCDEPQWRGALLGHLAVTELTSSEANLCYGAALRRLGLDSPDATEYFDEHVEADAAHGPLAARQMVAAFAREEPELADSVLRGGQMLLRVEGRLARWLWACWEAGASSLRGTDR